MILLSLILLNLIVPQTIASEVFIKVNKFLVPQIARVGDVVSLRCQYEISGANLHAFKLFKDDREFYRFTPTGKQEDQKMQFQIVGAKVNLSKSDDREASIRILDKRAAGQFKCQVSVEGTFQSISAEKRMEVQEAPLRRQPDRVRLQKGAGFSSGLGAVGQQLQQQQRHSNLNPQTRQQQQQARQLPNSGYSIDSLTSMQQSSRAARHWIGDEVVPLRYITSLANLMVLLSSLWIFALARH